MTADGPIPRRVIVTGALGGIGGAVAEAFADAGADVRGIDVRVADPAGPVACVAPADLADAAAAAAAVAQAADELGGVDVVVNAAGASGRSHGDGPVHLVSDEGWRWTLGANLDSTFHVCRAAVPLLSAAGGGAIVNVSSVLGLGGDRDFTTHAYAAAKGAVIALTRSMAVTYAPDRIRVNVVCPGLIDTPMSARAGADPAIRERLGELQPLTGTLGTPADVAGAVMYVATAPFVTGAVLTCDGGWTAR
ncbi:SDR family NAD(P)-dependent oxidoreductase [Desertimonas flava]|uniref:SDR family NAD(P)-dependent oxidoreductase n=1 Tax=Desertimonas flava TaxID=2064846 RepID=UPI000E3423DD|nr:SDR family oxidoreductase [Desertimonas flava]